MSVTFVKGGIQMDSTIQEYLDALRGKRVAVIGIGVSNTPLIKMLLRADIPVTCLLYTSRCV